MMQRAGIICALLGDPQIIIIDEPTTGLDPEERVAVRNILSCLSRERIVILSTHIASDIEAVASRILLLQQGSLVFNGSPEELIARAKRCVWEFVMLGAALMLSFRFPDQPLPFYDFISPFIGIYPGIVFASAFAVLLESIQFDFPMGQNQKV